jgi:hypothetical protein
VARRTALLRSFVKATSWHIWNLPTRPAASDDESISHIIGRCFYSEFNLMRRQLSVILDCLDKPLVLFRRSISWPALIFPTTYRKCFIENIAKRNLLVRRLLTNGCHWRAKQEQFLLMFSWGVLC